MAANDVFVDTAGWANYFIDSELHHRQAKDLLLHSRQSHARVVTTNYVVAEFASLLISPLRIPRSAMIRTLSAIRSSSWVDIIHIDGALDEEAWTLLKERPDKPWSLVDCASFAVMRRYNLLEALTSDRHFEQAGFVRLLK
jgi:predicted nucleic acid-binding protein